MKALLAQLLGRMFALVRSLGPYAAIELLLPGGSMLALLYWWHRRRVRRVRVISQFGTCLEVQPCSKSLTGANPVRALTAAVSRARARSGGSRAIALAQPQATPLCSCRSLAA